MVVFQLTYCRYIVVSQLNIPDLPGFSGANHAAVWRNASDKNLGLIRIDFVSIQDGATKPSGLLHEFMIRKFTIHSRDDETECD